MSAPAALACAKLLYPEKEESKLTSEEIMLTIHNIKSIIANQYIFFQLLFCLHNFS
jgi:hypothetical protein